MRRVLTAAVILALTLGIAQDHGLPTERETSRLPHLRAVAATHANRGPCDEERWLRITPREWTPELVGGLVRCAVRRWPVSGGAPKALSVFQCESSLFPWASANGNLGIGQLRFWLDRVSRYLRAQWFNDAQWQRIRTIPRGAFVARANVIVSVRLAHSGWGPWEAGKCA